MVYFEYLSQNYFCGNYDFFATAIHHINKMTLQTISMNAEYDDDYVTNVLLFLIIITCMYN